MPEYFFLYSLYNGYLRYNSLGIYLLLFSYYLLIS